MTETSENSWLQHASPLQVCASAVGRIYEFWEDVATRSGGKTGSYFPAVFGPIWDDEDTGEKFEAEIEDWENQPEHMQPFALLQAAFIATAYACQGIKAEKAGDVGLAWSYTARCQYWTGIVVGVWSI